MKACLIATARTPISGFFQRNEARKDSRSEKSTSLYSYMKKIVEDSARKQEITSSETQLFILGFNRHLLASNWISSRSARVRVGLPSPFSPVPYLCLLWAETCMVPVDPLNPMTDWRLP